MGKVDRAERSGEEGFTLIELMVVILVVAILIAIALPSFLAARNRAQDRAAQTMVRTALSAEIVFYGGVQRFSDDTAAGGELDSIEPDVSWGILEASAKGVIPTVVGATQQGVILRSQSRTGTTYCIGRIEAGANAGTYFIIGCDGSEDDATVASWPTTVGAGW